VCLKTEKDARTKKKQSGIYREERKGWEWGSQWEWMLVPSEFSPTVRVSLLTRRTEPYIKIAFIKIYQAIEIAVTSPKSSIRID